MSALETAFDTLNAQTMQLTKYTDTEIEGTIEVTQPGYFVLSITNEPGWMLYVDGIEVEKEVFAEAFISTYLEEGGHTISLHYETPGVMMGAAVSGICILAFCVTVLIKKKISLNRETDYRQMDTLTVEETSDKM